MGIPMIDMNELDGENRSKTMAILNACEKWGCFRIKNRGADTELMEKVKRFVNTHYEENLKASFYESQTTKCLENANVIKSAEKLLELICENFGLDKDHIKRAFSGRNGPSVGTKVVKYPECGIIVMLQDERVLGLEFLHDRQRVLIPPSNDATICVNTGGELDVLSNGRYKSVLHRVMAEKNGSRLSGATFHNLADDAIISLVPMLLYLEKFQGKEPRLESIRKLMSNGCSGAA
ncbi:hypothetical protein EUGRSUZ_C03875 [Eucalyptus grandis]|uniref:Uncharacterized protein n=2 Tax=Eucalyptus grandis TaxID=71139 RepID=A0ACC3LJ46_EUCGR|nr:hypothetical protein EUGRSUZ_C03875 [Eucalyptus grandis]